ncbi:MAG: hypothetical protein VYE73_13305 [Acidobacteriota bacterium]|nr:hypothetical protein [Acidobacteriota bacterium]
MALTSTPPTSRGLPRPCRVVDLVGNPEVRLFAKAEYTNPGGSVKDRPGLAMVEDAIARGALSPEKRILAAYGAELVLTDPVEGFGGAIREALREQDRGPGSYPSSRTGRSTAWKA